MRTIITLSFIILLLNGCGQTLTIAPSTATEILPTKKPADLPTATILPSTITPSPTSEPPTPTSTFTPLKHPLVVCAEKTTTLNPFSPSQAANDVLAFLFTYPVEEMEYRWIPRLVTHIPNFSNGDVITRTIELHNGATYVDEEDVVRVHTGSKPLILSQMVVTFTLKADLKWSDSQPLTATDVVYGYSLAQSPQAYGQWHDLADRTSVVSAIDGQRVRWEGLPGFTSTAYPGFLFPPQPRHKWQDWSFTKILLDRNPPVTGPYRIVEWSDNQSLILEANPHFSGQTAQTEHLIIKFPHVKQALWPEMLKVGTCDILLPGNNGNTGWDSWLRLIENEYAVMWNAPSSTVLRLDFNLAPPNRGTTALSSTRTRLGLANCISREHLQQLPLGDAGIPANSFIPPSHPEYDSSVVWRVPYSIEVGQGILSEEGWWDEDGDGIREAHDIKGIKDNTPLTLTLSTTTRQLAVAEILVDDFQTCGVGIVIDAQGPQQFYAVSSVSPIYARNFELALYNWQAETPQGCTSWLSDHLPENLMTGGDYNYGSYTNIDFDTACHQALDSVDIGEQFQALHTAQSILSEEHATLFLIWQPRWFVSKPEITGLKPDSSTYGRLWNPEFITVEKD